jgi:hypothetical protein
MNRLEMTTYELSGPTGVNHPFYNRETGDFAAMTGKTVERVNVDKDETFVMHFTDGSAFVNEGEAFYGYFSAELVSEILEFINSKGAASWHEYLTWTYAYERAVLKGEQPPTISEFRQRPPEW